MSFQVITKGTGMVKHSPLLFEPSVWQSIPSAQDIEKQLTVMVTKVNNYHFNNPYTKVWRTDVLAHCCAKYKLVHLGGGSGESLQLQWVVLLGETVPVRLEPSEEAHHWGVGIELLQPGSTSLPVSLCFLYVDEACSVNVLLLLPCFACHNGHEL